MERQEEKVSGKSCRVDFPHPHFKPRLRLLDKRRLGCPLRALYVEHPPRGPCRPPRQIRRVLAHDIPKARYPSRRAHRARDQVKSLTAEVHEAHEAAAFLTAKALPLQSALGAPTVTQSDLARHEAEEASCLDAAW
jgi:transposase